MTPTIKKANTGDTSYISGFASKEGSVVHFGLDKLEVRFNACSETFIELARYSKGHTGRVKLRFNQNFQIWYDCYYAVTNSSGYAKGITVGLKYKGYDQELLFVSFSASESGYAGKVRVDGKMFRLCKLPGSFDFNQSDILNFIEQHFINPQVFQFDLCADLKVDAKIANRGFLADLLADIKERRVGMKRGTNLEIVSDGDLNIRTLYDGELEEDDNKKYLVRVYDKTHEAEKKSKLRHLYSEYIEQAEQTRIFRFEISFMKKVAKDLLSFNELKDPIKTWGLFLTQLQKRRIMVFQGLNYERHKNLKNKSTVGGGVDYKLHILKLNHRLKSVITGIDKLQAEGIDPIEIRRKMINGSYESDRREQFVFYYENILITSLRFFKNGKYRYRDFAKEIGAQIELIETAFEIPFDDFIDIVNGFIRPTLELLAKEQYKSLIFMSYVAYKLRISLGNDKILRFLRVFDEEEILDFSEKNLKSEIKKFNSFKTVQFIHKQIEANGPENPENKEFIFKLLQKANELESYPVT